jgi:hypothetical protein
MRGSGLDLPDWILMIWVVADLSVRRAGDRNVVGGTVAHASSMSHEVGGSRLFVALVAPKDARLATCAAVAQAIEFAPRVSARSRAGEMPDQVAG